MSETVNPYEPPLATEDESVAPPDLTGASHMGQIGPDETITEPLVVAFKVIMCGEFLNRFPQRIFTEQDHSVEARFLYSPYKPLRVGIQIGRSRR